MSFPTPQPQYIHVEYPKIIGYGEDGKAIVAQNAEHHQELTAVAGEPAAPVEPTGPPRRRAVKSHHAKPVELSGAGNDLSSPATSHQPPATE